LCSQFWPQGQAGALARTEMKDESTLLLFVVESVCVHKGVWYSVVKQQRSTSRRERKYCCSAEQ
jgi:hypothetical protein